MDILKIEEDLKDYLKQKNLNLFEVKYLKTDQILQVVLDEKIELDQLETISNDLSSYMDKYDEEFDSNYILDVTTVGVERPIRNKDELFEAVGKYIYVKYKDGEVSGFLKKFENDILAVEYKEKTVTKIKNIEYSKVKKVRYAVKF